MKTRLITAMLLLMYSTPVLAESSYCFKGMVTIGTFTPEKTRELRKLLRFELKEHVEVMNDDGDCDYELEGFVISSDDGLRAGIRVLENGQKEKTLSTSVDDEPELMQAIRDLSKRLGQWDRDEERENVTKSSPKKEEIVGRAQIQVSKVGNSNSTNKSFEFGAAAGAALGLGLNINSELAERMFFVRRNYGHLSLRIDLSTIELLDANPAVPDGIVSKQIGAGIDIFAFATGFSPYLGISGTYALANFPATLAEQENSQEIERYMYEGGSAAGRVGLAIVRQNNVPVRLSVEGEYRMVPLETQGEFAGIAAAKVLLSIVPSTGT